VKIDVMPRLSSIVVSIPNNGDTIKAQIINEKMKPLNTFNDPSNNEADLLCFIYNSNVYI